MTQYDDTNRGALFPPRNKPDSSEPNTRVILTGEINDNGQKKRVAAVMVTTRDGKDIIDLYEKVGTLYQNNDKKTDKHPDYSGPFGNRRVSVWTKQAKETGLNYMSLSLSDKRGEPTEPDVGF